MIPMVLERKPLVRQDGNCPRLKTTEVEVAVKKGREIHIGSRDMVRPDADCWFCVCIEYPELRLKTNAIDHDVIITNGNEFWRARRDLGESPFILNDASIEAIHQAITQFLG